MFPGDVIDERFEVERFVARGGMGDVYRARDRATGKIVALKFLIDRQEALLHRLDRASVDRSKAASRGRVKTGQLSGTQDGVVYPARPSERKRSVRSLVRQLLGPHLST
jgi:serine/threonine protein kinase